MDQKRRTEELTMNTIYSPYQGH